MSLRKIDDFNIAAIFFFISFAHDLGLVRDIFIFNVEANGNPIFKGIASKCLYFCFSRKF